MAKNLCLLYHRIIDLKEDYYNIAVTPEKFEEHIKFLSERYSIIRFEDIGKDIREDSVAITFDDGYEDNYLNAFPILKKYGVPATIFVSTANINSQNEFWWDELIRLFMERKMQYPFFELQDKDFNYRWMTRTKRECMEAALALRHLLRREPNGFCWGEWRRQLLEWSGLQEEGRLMNRSMTSDQLIDLSNSGLVDIGGHTENHFSLGAADLDEKKKECEKSIETLQSILGKKIKTFSYPFGGARDYDEQVFDILASNGIDIAATTESRRYNEADGKYSIPRVTVKNWTVEEFSAKIQAELEK